ncbi:MAG: hypothetical protein J6A15_05035 [Clostridia bacterium]|nr:hypothetical protein [Clostridia bacterium]
MENNLKMPVTGGLFSTDGLIILAVAIVFAIGYVLFCILRENKNDDLKDFRDDDFIDDEQ